MASFTLGPDPRFPAGTELVVYEDGTLDRPPAKDSITTGTVGDTGLVTFQGLASNTRYVAGILDGGGWRAAAFTTGPEPEVVVGAQWPLNLQSFDVGRDDDSAAITLAVERAQNEDRSLYIPGGVYRSLSTLTYNPDKPLTIYGDGKDATTLYWATDLGSGQYAFKRANQAVGGHQYTPTVRDLEFRGKESSFTRGTPPCLMYGPELGPAMRFIRVKVKSFYAPVRTADHQIIRDCVFNGCHYNLYVIPDASTAKGNMLIEGSNLDGATMASIGVAEGVNLDGDRIISTHLGFAPYGIYAEAGSSEFMTDSMLQSAWFEACGNGAIFVAGQGRDCSRNAILGCYSSWDDTYKIAAVGRDYGIAVRTIWGMVIDSPMFLREPPGIARMYTAGGAVDIVWRSMGAVLDNAQSDGIPIIYDPNFGGVVDCEWQGAGARGQFLYNGQGGALAVGDLVSQSTANDNNVLRSTTLPPVGVVVVGATDSHTMLPVAQSGRVTVLTNSAAGIARGDRLKLDTANAGKAAKAAASDADQIGYCRHVTDTTHVTAYLTRLG